MKSGTDGDAQRGLLRSAAVVSSVTLLSRLTGFLQSFFLAHYLGAGASADAFFVAFRLPNLLRRFTAEGTMTAAFLPTLAEVEAREGEDAVRDVAAKFLGTLLTLLSALVLVTILAMGIIAGLLVIGRLQPHAGFFEQLSMLGRILTGQIPPPPEMALTVKLARIMFPYLVLVSLTAGLGGLLNLRHRFALAASVSIFWNLAFIAFAWIAIRWHGVTDTDSVAIICAFAVLVGGLVQLIAVWPACRALGFGINPGLHWRNPAVALTLRRMGPGLIGAGIYPINALVSTMLASNLAPGAQTVLFNSGMMGEMVLGLFAMSLATASLPLLSRQAEAKDFDGMRDSLGSALRAAALMAIPACVGMAVLAKPIVALLFQTGKYTAADVDWTATTLVFQSVGLIFVASQRISTQALYALKDYRGPVITAGVSLLANIVLSVLLMRYLGTGGLALANGLSSLVGLMLLSGMLDRKLGELPTASVLKAWLQMLVAATAMGLLAYGGMKGMGLDMFRGRLHLLLRLFPLMALCAVVYGAAMLAFRNAEAEALWNGLRRRLRR